MMELLNSYLVKIYLYQWNYRIFWQCPSFCHQLSILFWNHFHLFTVNSLHQVCKTRIYNSTFLLLRSFISERFVLMHLYRHRKCFIDKLTFLVHPVIGKVIKWYLQQTILYNTKLYCVCVCVCSIYFKFLCVWQLFLFMISNLIDNPDKSNLHYIRCKATTEKVYRIIKSIIC